MLSRDTIREQYDRRTQTGAAVPLKINLFKGYELYAVARIVERLLSHGTMVQVECVMLGDSLLTTHLGYASTVIAEDSCRHLFMKVFNEHLHELRLALNANTSEEFHPYLIADMPFGSAGHVDGAARHADSMIRFGAEVLKIEAFESNVINVVEELSANGYLVMGHIGYTPQTGGRKSRGTTLDDAQQLFAMARRLRDAGAVALVLEGVSSVVNAQLSMHQPNGLPVYSIFSGPAGGGGQSINVWDCVVRPPFSARFFPTTASLTFEDLPSKYTSELIEECVEQLLRLILAGKWPDERNHTMSEAEVTQLQEIDPWTRTLG